MVFILSCLSLLLLIVSSHLQYVIIIWLLFLLYYRDCEDESTSSDHDMNTLRSTSCMILPGSAGGQRLTLVRSPELVRLHGALRQMDWADIYRKVNKFDLPRKDVFSFLNARCEVDRQESGDDDLAVVTLMQGYRRVWEITGIYYLYGVNVVR